MCWFFIVIKVLLLKLLLASISGLNSSSSFSTAAAYEYGYHPSAEEFDNLLRETHRTWTHDILNQQTQRRVYNKEPTTTTNTDEVKRTFVPKFQYESHLNKFNQIPFNTNNPTNPNSHDLQFASSSHNNNRFTGQNLGSSLDFHYINEEGNEEEENLQPVSHNKPKETKVQLSSTVHTMPEINLKPLSKPEMEKYSLNNLYRNNSLAHFPIYFTNPATGIVYAITEMGKSSANATRTNGSIPIFITKEQYERDILLLKTEYEKQCARGEKDKNKPLKLNIPSSFSRPSTTTTTTSTTIRPQIIRLQRPSVTSTSSSSTKLITPLKRPQPVIVKTQVTVKDKKGQTTTARPVKKKTKLKNKRKAKRKNKPPGHHTTPRPNAGGGPTIVKGTRITTGKPYTDAYKLSTQLEKPNFGTTIFSTSPLAATVSNIGLNDHLHFNNLERNRRSIEGIEGYFREEDEIINDENHLKSTEDTTKKSNKINLNLENLNNKRELKLEIPNQVKKNYLNLNLKLKEQLKMANKIKQNIENPTKSIESEIYNENIKNTYKQINWHKKEKLKSQNIENINKPRSAKETKSDINYFYSEKYNMNSKLQRNSSTDGNIGLHFENVNENIQKYKGNTNKLNDIEINTEDLNKKSKNTAKKFNKLNFESIDKIKQNTILKQNLGQSENLDKMESEFQNNSTGFKYASNLIDVEDFNKKAKDKEIGAPKKFDKHILESKDKMKQNNILKVNLEQSGNLDKMEYKFQNKPRGNVNNNLILIGDFIKKAKRKEISNPQNFDKRILEPMDKFKQKHIFNEHVWPSENRNKMESEFHNEYLNKNLINLKDSNEKANTEEISATNKIKSSSLLKDFLWQSENRDKKETEFQNKPSDFHIEYLNKILIQKGNEDRNFAKTSLKSKENDSPDYLSIHNSIENKLNENDILWPSENRDKFETEFQNKPSGFHNEYLNNNLNNNDNEEWNLAKTSLKSKENYDLDSKQNKFNKNINYGGKARLNVPDNSENFSNSAKDNFRNAKMEINLKKLKSIMEKTPFKNEYVLHQHFMEAENLKNNLNIQNSQANKHLLNNKQIEWLKNPENVIKSSNTEKQLLNKTPDIIIKNPHKIEEIVQQDFIKTNSNLWKFKNIINIDSKGNPIFEYKTNLENPYHSEQLLYSNKFNSRSKNIQDSPEFLNTEYSTDKHNKLNYENPPENKWISKNVKTPNVDTKDLNSPSVLYIENLYTNLKHLNKSQKPENVIHNLLKLTDTLLESARKTNQIQNFKADREVKSNIKDSEKSIEHLTSFEDKVTTLNDKIDLPSERLNEKRNTEKNINSNSKSAKEIFLKPGEQSVRIFLENPQLNETNSKYIKKLLKLKENYLKVPTVHSEMSEANKQMNVKIQNRLEKNKTNIENGKSAVVITNESDSKNLMNTSEIIKFPSDNNGRSKINKFEKQYESENENSETKIRQSIEISNTENTTDSVFSNLRQTNYSKPIPLIETHHVHKRSADIIKGNASEPKFQRKATNSTEENFLEIKQNFGLITKSSTSNLTNSNQRLSRNTQNSNQTYRSSTNSKITNFRRNSNQKFLANLKIRKVTRKKNRKSQNRTKTLKKHKRVNKVSSLIGNATTETVSTNSTNSTNMETSTPRSLKKELSKLPNYNMVHKRAKISQEDKDKDKDEDDDEEYSEEDDDDDDPEYPDQDDLEEQPTTDNSSSAEESADFGALEEDQTENTTPTTTTNIEDDSQTKNSPDYSDLKKRYRRRPPPPAAVKDYDDDEEDEDSGIGSNLGGFFRMIFYPVEMLLSGIMDTFVGGKDTEEPASYTKYTSYHNTLKKQASDDYAYDDEDADYDTDSGDSSVTGWFSSLFGLNRRNKKIGSTTPAPSEDYAPSKPSNWFQSWFGFGGDNDGDNVDKTDPVVHEDDDAYDKWFSSWFGDVKPKARKRTTTTTSTTTQLPQVPILTIVDPMRNPQNWIGILAHHIINHTSTTTTQNPLKDIWSMVTSPATTTSTENPDIPRKISYNKYQIWRLKPQDDSQVQALEEYKKGDDGIKLQWLKGPSLRGLTDVLVPPRMLVDFQASLTFETIDHEVLIFDVGKAIAYEKSKEDYFFTTTQKPKKRKNHNRYANKPQAMTWMRYYEFEDIVTYLENMRMRYPQLVELIHIGRSYEGRPLIIMKIESKEAAAANSANLQMNDKSKLRNRKRIGLANAVFIEAGIHGTEWIAPATATWIINELLKIMKNNKSSSDEQSLIRNTTWYIMPVINPDGYVYSHEYDRFWKKSRSRHIARPSGLISSAMTWLQKKKTKDKVCYGVDLDRNWNYQWGKRGSSRTPCNEFYAGPGPFSEPETKALSEFLMDYRTHIKLYISMQAYGQIISYPYKANTTYDTERLDDFLDVAMVGTDGLRKKGSKARYKIDATNDLVENRSGSSDAFVAYDVGIPFSYTMHLADNGVHGYLLPSSSIESTSRDAFEIIIGMLDYI